MLDNVVLLGVAPIIGVLLPIIDIDIGNAANEKLKLALIKDVDEIWRDELVEPGDEGLELLFDALLNAPLGDQTNM